MVKKIVLSEFSPLEALAKWGGWDGRLALLRQECPKLVIIK